jgi:hypothetical protein
MIGQNEIQKRFWRLGTKMGKKRAKTTKRSKSYESITLNNRNPGILTPEPMFEESSAKVQETSSTREPKVKNETVYN